MNFLEITTFQSIIWKLFWSKAALERCSTETIIKPFPCNAGRLLDWNSYSSSTGNLSRKGAYGTLSRNHKLRSHNKLKWVAFSKKCTNWDWWLIIVVEVGGLPLTNIHLTSLNPTVWNIFNPLKTTENRECGYLMFSGVRKLDWLISSKWGHVILYYLKVLCSMLISSCYFRKKGSSAINCGKSFFIENHKMLGETWGRNRLRLQLLWKNWQNSHRTPAIDSSLKDILCRLYILKPI